MSALENEFDNVKVDVLEESAKDGNLLNENSYFEIGLECKLNDIELILQNDDQYFEKKNSLEIPTLNDNFESVPRGDIMESEFSINGNIDCGNIYDDVENSNEHSDNVQSNTMFVDVEM